MQHYCIKYCIDSIEVRNRVKSSTSWVRTSSSSYLDTTPISTICWTHCLWIHASLHVCMWRRQVWVSLSNPPCSMLYWIMAQKLVDISNSQLHTSRLLKTIYLYIPLLSHLSVCLAPSDCWSCLAIRCLFLWCIDKVVSPNIPYNRNSLLWWCKCIKSLGQGECVAFK